MSDKQERAVQARALVEEGLFAECLTQLEADYIRAWRDAKTTEERERLHTAVSVIADIRLDLISIITTGDIDAAENP